MCTIARRVHARTTNPVPASKCTSVPCAETPRPYCPAPPQLHAASTHSRLPTTLIPHRIHSSGGPPTLAPLAVYAAMCIKTYAVIPAVFRPAAPPCIVPPLAHVTHSARSPHPGAACIATIASAISDALSPLARTHSPPASLCHISSQIRHYDRARDIQGGWIADAPSRTSAERDRCRGSRMLLGRAGGKRRQLGENIPTFQASAIPGTLLPSSHAHPARNG
ncbi:hypothetical protein B0H13DRAFT_2315263 [Mycena leptocephala]|nr:hypothetical protein B0H13DRAFT_2315263 [Mycena leptocephala]